MVRPLNVARVKTARYSCAHMSPPSHNRDLAVDTTLRFLRHLQGGSTSNSCNCSCFSAHVTVPVNPCVVLSLNNVVPTTCLSVQPLREIFAEYPDILSTVNTHGTSGNCNSNPLECLFGYTSWRSGTKNEPHCA